MVVAGTSGLPGGFMLTQNNSPATSFLTNNYINNKSAEGSLFHHTQRTATTTSKNANTNKCNGIGNEYTAETSTIKNNGNVNNNNNDLYDGNSSSNVYSGNTDNNSMNNTVGPLQLKA